MSSVVVAGTLLINAGAVLNFRLSANKEETFGDEVSHWQVAGGVGEVSQGGEGGFVSSSYWWFDMHIHIGNVFILDILP